MRQCTSTREAERFMSEPIPYLAATNQLVVQVPVMSREDGIPARH
jgi:hypothetical protein